MSLRTWYFEFLEWRRQHENPPHVVINYGSQLTKQPKAYVSIEGARGMLGIYEWIVDEAGTGDAKAWMYGNSLADILGCKLYDEREPFQHLGANYLVTPYRSGRKRDAVLD